MVPGLLELLEKVMCLGVGLAERTTLERNSHWLLIVARRWVSNEAGAAGISLGAGSYTVHIPHVLVAVVSINFHKHCGWF